MKNQTGLKIKIFADGAVISDIEKLCQNPLIKGFTTNPTLMKKAGITDYEKFALEALKVVDGKSISFEVFSDEFDVMERQALKISAWGDNVYVKIPVTNTKGESAINLLGKLVAQNVKVNVTAMTTPKQVKEVAEGLADGPSSYVSVFAGRVADTGIDPVELMKECLDIIKPYPHLELIWASPRELLNLIQADQIGCHIITITPDILKKIPLLGKNLDEYSLETVKMFYQDASAAGFNI